MNKNPEIRPELMKKGVGGINRDVAVFTFFLFLAFFFWYLNSLGKEAEAGIKYPVIYTNLPRGKAIADSPQLWINLYMKGKGSLILKLKYSGNRTPLNIDISKANYMRVPGTSEAYYYLVSSGLLTSFSVQLRSGCEITSVKPDTLFFKFEKAVPETGKSGDDEK